MNEILTLDQARAKHALSKLKPSYEKDHISDMKGIPSMIIASGLGHTVAFYRAKQSQHKFAYQAIEAVEDWLSNRISGSSTNKLEERIAQGDALFLRRATDEAMAYLQWYIRLAEGRKN